MQIRNFLLALAAAANVAAQYHLESCPSTVSIKGQPFPKLIEATLEELQIGLESGLFTVSQSFSCLNLPTVLTYSIQSVDLVNAYLGRIGEMNGTLHMVTEVNPDALAIAADLDAARAAGNVTGPLHGIPVLIKNNIATDDLMNNTAGSFALLGAKVNRDSTMARKLREAGAVILGKSNLSQWANYRSSNTSNGWSAYGSRHLSTLLPAIKLTLY